MKKYIRSERANLFEPNVYISMIAKLSGNLFDAEIEQAVYAAYEANEATMSKIVLEPDGNARYEKRETSGCTFFTDEVFYPFVYGTAVPHPDRCGFAAKPRMLSKLTCAEDGKGYGVYR